MIECVEMIQEVMKRRRSIRRFRRETFPLEKLCSILKAGLLAPSGADQNPYIFVIIDDEIVYVGSHNWSESALYYNRETSTKIISDSIADTFKEYFSTI